MRTNYEVIEYRGCGVEYSVFQGSLEGCKKWLRDHCYQDMELMGDMCWVNNDPTCVNGNGFSWKYSIHKITN